MLNYICKYTPIAVLDGLGVEYEKFTPKVDSFQQATALSHSNLCSFSKSIIETVLNGEIDELILTNCCDSMRRAYDVLRNYGKMKFLYLIDLPRCDTECSKKLFEMEISKFTECYSEYTNKSFDYKKALNSFEKANNEIESKPYISILGARVGEDLKSLINELSPYNVIDNTCSENIDLRLNAIPTSEGEFFKIYADTLLSSTSCMRMTDISSRKKLYSSPNLKGIVYHTVKFCDYYNYEYSDLLKKEIPMVKTETDLINGSAGQIKTRVEAFFETLGKESSDIKVNKNGKLFAGIDSGSTSTNVVIIDENKNIVSSSIVRTGAKAVESAKKAYEEALSKANLIENDIALCISTGYGRNNLNIGEMNVTEITCHAKGAYFLDNSVRTIVDIGGQDSKIISLLDDGTVKSFQMNDKCAAGTGRFLENMAKVLEISVSDMANLKYTPRESLKISNMCTVFAESEIVSLIAENKRIDDIIDAINDSVCSKVISLLGRTEKRPSFMMTGGVANNKGIVKKLSEKLKADVIVKDEAQLCGALGAALIAREKVVNKN